MGSASYPIPATTATALVERKSEHKQSTNDNLLQHLYLALPQPTSRAVMASARTQLSGATPQPTASPLLLWRRSRESLPESLSFSCGSPTRRAATAPAPAQQRGSGDGIAQRPPRRRQTQPDRNSHHHPAYLVEGQRHCSPDRSHPRSGAAAKLVAAHTERAPRAAPAGQKAGHQRCVWVA